MLSLPDEILLNVFSEVEPFNVLPLRRVCKRWRCIIDTSTTLQLQIECLLDGRDLPAAGNSWYGELQKMRRSNLAWETLTPAMKSSFRGDEVNGSDLKFHNGLVGLLHESEGELEMWEYRDVAGFKSVAKHTHVGLQPGHYAFDRAQDVLVLLEQEKSFKLHIRKLSTNGRHQGAAKETITVKCKGEITPQQIEIHGCYIAVLISWWASTFSLVDWKEGTVLLDNMERVCNFCFIDVRTILLVVKDKYSRKFLQAISLPLDIAHTSGVLLALPDLEENYQYASLELKTDGGRFIGLCVGIDLVVRYAGTRDSDSDFLLLIDRPGLLKFLSGICLGQGVKCVRNWAEWESGITTILPIENNSYQMAWAVFGRRIVINAEAETLPFAKSAMEIANENQAEGDSHKIDEGQTVEGQGDSDYRERLIVIDFGCHRLASVVEAGDASGNIIRSRTHKAVSLLGVREISSEELPYRMWMERTPSRLPSGQVYMSESMILAYDENDDGLGIKSIRVFEGKLSIT